MVRYCWNRMVSCVSMLCTCLPESPKLWHYKPSSECSCRCLYREKNDVDSELVVQCLSKLSWIPPQAARWLHPKNTTQDKRRTEEGTPMSVLTVAWTQGKNAPVKMTDDVGPYKPPSTAPAILKQSIVFLTSSINQIHTYSTLIHLTCITCPLRNWNM